MSDGTRGKGKHSIEHKVKGYTTKGIHCESMHARRFTRSTYTRLREHRVEVYMVEGTSWLRLRAQRRLTNDSFYLSPRCSVNKQNNNSRNRLVGLAVKASASSAKDPGFEFRLHRDFFSGRVIPVT